MRPAPLPRPGRSEISGTGARCKAHWLITKDRALLELKHRVRLAAGYDVLDPAEAILRLAELKPSRPL